MEVTEVRAHELSGLPPFLTVEEAATILRLKKSTAYALIRRGQLPAVRLGKQIRVLGSGLTALVAESKPQARLAKHASTLTEVIQQLAPGRSLRSIATAGGIGYSALAKAAKGKRRVTPQLLEGIARGLGVDPGVVAAALAAAGQVVGPGREK